MTKQINNNDQQLAQAEVDYDWSKAPVWASWAYMNLSGQAVWSHRKPNGVNDWCWWCSDESLYEHIEPGAYTGDPSRWKESLRQRPQEPVVFVYPWEEAPPWANHAAMDSNGDAYWYSYPPIKRSCCWVRDTSVREAPSRTERTERIDVFYANPWTLLHHWGESLQTRPRPLTEGPCMVTECKFVVEWLDVCEWIRPAYQIVEVR